MRLDKQLGCTIVQFVIMFRNEMILCVQQLTATTESLDSVQASIILVQEGSPLLKYILILMSCIVNVVKHRFVVPIAFQQNCPTNLVFDPVIQHCVLYQDSSCYSGINFFVSTTQSNLNCLSF